MTTVFMARHRFARTTARKARLVADMIRGRPVNEALRILQFSPRRAAAFYLGVVRSAVANAAQDEDVDVNRLVVVDSRADDGPLLNDRMRFRPGPQGRAMPFAKRLSTTVRLAVEQPAEAKGARKSKRSTVRPSTTPDHR
jgi:large subunit ribosomal protein L22